MLPVVLYEDFYAGDEMHRLGVCTSGMGVLDSFDESVTVEKEEQSESVEGLQSEGENGMIRQTINFTDDGRVNMRTYVHAETNGQNLPAIIVLPGGAYGFLSGSEGEPVALTFYDKGFHTVVLNYSVGDDSAYPAPLDDVSKVIWEIRRSADVWNVDPDVYIPDILGKIARDKTPELDVVDYVGSHTSPMFIWHNRYDRLVPANSPLVMAQALYENNIPFEVHVFQEGRRDFCGDRQ